MEPSRLAQLSSRYARYGHSLPGLSLALGGVVMLMLLIAPPALINHLDVSNESGFGLLALTVAVLLAGWVLLKEWLRQRVYMQLGMAEAPVSTAEILFNRILTVTLTLLALACPVMALSDPHPLFAPSPVQIYIGLTACLALPWCTLRFIRGVQEGLLWFILCFWGLELVWVFPFGGGRIFGVGPLSVILFLTLPLAYLGGLIVGLVQHFNFMRLAREIRGQETPDE